MSAIEQTAVITTDFLIEPNPQYDFNHKLSDAYVVQNIAEDVNYAEVGTSSTNTQQLTFNVDPANLFTGRGFTLNLDIPLTFERTTAATVAITQDNYVTAFMDNYSSLSWKQFGFINAIQNITVTMDGFNYTVTDVAEMMKIVSRYYDEDIVHQRVPASLPDCMDYSNYAETNAVVKTIALDQESSLAIKPTIINTHNVFGNMGNPDYNTRTPMIVFGSSTTTKLSGSIKSETCFIPFSVFGIQGLDTQPLVGVKSMSIKIGLKNSWEKHLFCTKGKFFKAVGFDHSRVTDFKVNIQYKTFNAPQYVDAAHGLSQTVPDYNMKFQICELQNSVQQVSFSATDKQKNLPILSYKIRAVPKAIYIAAVLKADNDDDLINTPDVFCRIDNLDIEIAGKKTILPNTPIGLMNIAKANGYQDSMEIGYYLGGYPLKLNMTDDLGAKSNTLVGSRNNIQNELRISNLRLANVARAFSVANYDIRVICVYDSMLSYRNGKFQLIESLLEAADGVNIEAHVSSLYNNQIGGANMIGGSFGSLFAAAIPTMKKMGRGVFNVAKKFATDKEFRGRVVDAFNNAKALTTSAQPVTNFVERVPQPVNFVEQRGGYSSHVPIGGFSNTIGGRAVGHIRY